MSTRSLQRTSNNLGMWYVLDPRSVLLVTQIFQPTRLFLTLLKDRQRCIYFPTGTILSYGIRRTMSTARSTAAGTRWFSGNVGQSGSGYDNIALLPRLVLPTSISQTYRISLQPTHVTSSHAKHIHLLTVYTHGTMEHTIPKVHGSLSGTAKAAEICFWWNVVPQFDIIRLKLRLSSGFRGIMDLPPPSR
ncbi:hypothetical protein WG66_011363 [Moniliophthora roreri]|nr:hypothetical protein WG66_011363 [Moniliophthora roreri]